ncbi:MAG TPA: hypothetical protein ENJ53_11075 [Phaeodactylibacter sp.]|nr:hypothetical protein [Phaeodactylibacter sp.]
MENIAVVRLMRLINPLSVELKLEILSKLSEDIKANFSSEKINKDKLLDELFGAWADSNDNLAEDILKSRTISDKNISFN